ncbi:FtsX-like permease family protein [Roseivirga sp. E12]|uniref:FtsX-like permease family protein n=1 Tax=Roseivirga sp. E12 TaxID=2819237 RepID=UPI001ABD25E6|nr:FtsX-like permease family protein [Roseivirga sp. E12]MBO3700124.1 ABC transporter permease [Roseivirga sp. E12]
MGSNKNSPNNFFSKVLEFICKEELYEELQGDLDEEFKINVEKFGIQHAKRIYRKEVFKMMRPSVLKRLSINHTMRTPLLFHFFKISFRNLKRNFSYALLNVIGFAAALAVCLFCINAIYSNQQLDKKFSDGDRIYRVNLESKTLEGTSLSATSQIALYQKIQEALPEAENIALIQNQVMYTAAYLKGARRNLLGQGINRDFFKIFDYEMVLGSAESLFDNPKHIIITKKVMDKYYQEETVIGSSLGNYIISGVIEDPAKVSHLDFEFLHSKYEDHTGSPFYTSWKVHTMQILYIKVLPNIEATYVQEKLSQLSKEINEELNNEDEGIEYNYLLEPLDKVAQSNASLNKGALLSSDAQNMLIALMIVILIIANFNYTNLAMASAISRAKEVGIRKVLGTGKYSLVYQLLIETTILSLLGFGLALLIFKLLVPSVASFTDFNFQEHLAFDQVLLFFSFSLLTGIISGVVPGLFFSRISIMSLFRKSTGRNKLSIDFLKKGLMTTQVTVSLLVFTLGILVLSQSSLILNQTTPFSGEQLVALDLPPSDSLSIVFRTEVERLTGIESVAGTRAIPFIGSFGYYGVRKQHIDDPTHRHSAVILQADSGFLSTFSQSIEWLADKKMIKDRPYFLVNRAFATSMSDSIRRFNETTFSLGLDYYPVMGMISDLNLTDPVEAAKPAAIMITHEYPLGTLILRLNKASFARTLGEIGELYKTRYPNIDFQPVFVDDVLANRMRQFKGIVRALIFVFAAIVAITLMGQIGMAMYQAKTREKEIGVRKVLGASLRQVVQLILKSTLLQLIIAALIACPVAYLLFSELPLDFAVPLSVSTYHFAGAFLLFSLIIFTLVSSQTWKTASQNPVDSLQNE